MNTSRGAVYSQRRDSKSLYGLITASSLRHFVAHPQISTLLEKFEELSPAAVVQATAHVTALLPQSLGPSDNYKASSFHQVVQTSSLNSNPKGDRKAIIKIFNVKSKYR